MICFFFFKQKTAYEMRISDWSSDVCSSDLDVGEGPDRAVMLADDQHRFLADFGADIVARLLDVVRTAADQPDLRPDPLPLQLHERFAGISFGGDDVVAQLRVFRSEEHTSELQSLMRISYAVFCLKKKQYNKKLIPT